MYEMITFKTLKHLTDHLNQHDCTLEYVRDRGHLIEALIKAKITKKTKAKK